MFLLMIPIALVEKSLLSFQNVHIDNSYLFDLQLKNINHVISTTYAHYSSYAFFPTRCTDDDATKCQFLFFVCFWKMNFSLVVQMATPPPPINGALKPGEIEKVNKNLERLAVLLIVYCRKKVSKLPRLSLQEVSPIEHQIR